MTAPSLHTAAEHVVRRARERGHVVESEVREELQRAGVDAELWKDALALARASLSYRDGKYCYTGPSERARAEQSQQEAVRDAVTHLVEARQAARLDERREQGRIEYVQPVKVSCEDGREFTLITRDLSATGVRLIGTRRLLGQKVRVTLASEGVSLEFVVRVLWTCPLGEDLVENGGTFLSVTGG